MVDMERHARHLVLPQVGIEGQEKLANAKVLVVGAGGLGSPVLLYLALQVLVPSASSMMIVSIFPIFNVKFFIVQKMLVD